MTHIVITPIRTCWKMRLERVGMLPGRPLRVPLLPAVLLLLLTCFGARKDKSSERENGVSGAHQIMAVKIS